ncbi:MAG: hypothetical protein PHD76_07150 [Methylacidiphilales bacterium]|nr:hypothetical protein [Candidatus Methylacidiphilales bacterium]
MKIPGLVKGDIDGFFGLFIDNLLQLLLIATLCPLICGFPAEFVTHRILPAAALSILVGNLFYSWQARRLAQRTGRDDVTALPYGINTVTLIANIFLIMGPIYHATGDFHLAWKAGLFACFWSGIMEIIGAFAGDSLRRRTPRAAMLSALAGVAITFIAMGFVFQIFASPATALIPMLLIVGFYASGTKLPLGIPGGLLAVGVGVIIAWGLRFAGFESFHPISGALQFGLHLPVPVFGELWGILTQPIGWKYLSVILPMGFFGVIGSLQCLESAAAAGDHYETRSSLLMNGVGSLVAACFGSAFATTIYIGHPGWKAIGARHAYSAINGAVIAALCVTGALTAILKVVPMEAALGILLWIGLIIMAQSFQEVPRQHALAVAFGLVPALAAWALLLIETSLRVAGSSLFEAAPKFGNTLYIHGVMALSQGFLLSSMIFAAILVFTMERKLISAGLWTLVASVLSGVGLIHAYTLAPEGVQNKFGWLAAPDFFWCYLAVGLALLALGWAKARQARG